MKYIGINLILFIILLTKAVSFDHYEILRKGVGSSLQKEDFPLIRYKIYNEKGRCIEECREPISSGLLTTFGLKKALSHMQKKEIRRIYLHGEKRSILDIELVEKNFTESRLLAETQKKPIR